MRPSGLKSAFRKIALETHPDRARTLGKHASDLNDRFAEASSAYRKLKTAMNWGLLSLQDIREILAARQLGEKFGESAVRQGYLKACNLLALLGKQRRLQPRFGEYFLQNGWFTSAQTDAFFKMQQHHNREVLRNK